MTYGFEFANDTGRWHGQLVFDTPPIDTADKVLFRLVEDSLRRRADYTEIEAYEGDTLRLSPPTGNQGTIYSVTKEGGQTVAGKYTVENPNGDTLPAAIEVCHVTDL